MTVRPAKTQVSLGICPVWSESSVRMKKSCHVVAHIMQGCHKEKKVKYYERGIIQKTERKRERKKKKNTSTCTILFLSFRTDMLGQPVQIQIRLQRSSLIRVYSVCHSVCIVWTHYSMVEHIVQILEWLQQIVWVSEYLGNLRYNVTPILCHDRPFILRIETI